MTRSMKRCSVCGTEKDTDDFPLDRGHTTGRGPTCKPCRREWARRYRSNDPEIQRDQSLLRAYGVTSAEVDAMLVDQDGGCAICRTTVFGGPGRRPHVDHDHETGKVRGLLCHRCNTALGFFDDNVAVLIAALAYLREHQ